MSNQIFACLKLFRFAHHGEYFYLEGERLDFGPPAGAGDDNERDRPQRWRSENFSAPLSPLPRFLPRPLTLSLSFSFSLSMHLFSPSSSRSISLTVSPERVLNFFLGKFGREQRSRRRLGAPEGKFAAGINGRYNYCYIKPSCRRLEAIHFVQSGKSDEHNKQNMSQTFNNPLSTPPQFCLLAAITASL